MMQEISAPSPPPTGCPGLVFVFGGEVEGGETVVPDRLLFPALTGRDGRGREHVAAPLDVRRWALAVARAVRLRREGDADAATA